MGLYVEKVDDRLSRRRRNTSHNIFSLFVSSLAFCPNCLPGNRSDLPNVTRDVITNIGPKDCPKKNSPKISGINCGWADRLEGQLIHAILDQFYHSILSYSRCVENFPYGILVEKDKNSENEEHQRCHFFFLFLLPAKNFEIF